MIPTEYIIKPDLVMSLTEIAKEEDLFQISFQSMTKLEILQWGARRRVISNTAKCENCGLMVLHEHNSIDGYRWSCKHCNTKQNVRTGSFLANSQLPFKEIIHFINDWLFALNSYISEISEINPFKDWEAFCVGICEDSLLRHPIILGGLNYETGQPIIVEIAYFNITSDKDGKSNKNWIFGAYERESKQFVFIPVTECSVNTLMPLVEKYICEGSRIISNNWPVFNAIMGMKNRYTHDVISKGFVDPTDKTIHIQSVKCTWGKMKREMSYVFEDLEYIEDIKAMEDKKDNFNKKCISYLPVYSWKSKHRIVMGKKKNYFGSFLVAICEAYLP